MCGRVHVHDVHVHVVVHIHGGWVGRYTKEMFVSGQPATHVGVLLDKHQIPHTDSTDLADSCNANSDIPTPLDWNTSLSP